jgi:hypothetical protein
MSNNDDEEEKEQCQATKTTFSGVSNSAKRRFHRKENEKK